MGVLGKLVPSYSLDSNKSDAPRNLDKNEEPAYLKVLNPPDLPHSKFECNPLDFKFEGLGQILKGPERKTLLSTPELLYPGLNTGFMFPSTLKTERKKNMYVPKRMRQDLQAEAFLEVLNVHGILIDFLKTQASLGKWRFLRQFVATSFHYIPHKESAEENPPEAFGLKMDTLADKRNDTKAHLGYSLDQLTFLDEKEKTALLKSFYEGLNTIYPYETLGLMPISIEDDTVRQQVLEEAIRRGFTFSKLGSFSILEQTDSDTVVWDQIKEDLELVIPGLVSESVEDRKLIIDYITNKKLPARFRQKNHSELTLRTNEGILGLLPFVPNLETLKRWEATILNLLYTSENCLIHDLVAPFNEAGWIKDHEDIEMVLKLAMHCKFKVDFGKVMDRDESLPMHPAAYNFINAFIKKDRDESLPMHPAAYHFINASIKKDWSLVESFIDGHLPMNFFLIDRYASLNKNQQNNWKKDSHFFPYQNFIGNNTPVDLIEEIHSSYGPSFKELLPAISRANDFEARALIEMLYAPYPKGLADPRSKVSLVVHIEKTGLLPQAISVIEDTSFFSWDLFLKRLNGEKLPNKFKVLKSYQETTGYNLNPTIIEAFTSHVSNEKVDYWKALNWRHRLLTWQTFVEDCKKDLGLDFSKQIITTEEDEDRQQKKVLTKGWNFPKIKKIFTNLPYPVRSQDIFEYSIWINIGPKNISLERKYWAINSYIHNIHIPAIKEEAILLGDDLMVLGEAWDIEDSMAYILTYTASNLDEETFIKQFKKNIQLLPYFMENPMSLMMEFLYGGDYTKEHITRFQAVFPDFMENQMPLMMQLLHEGDYTKEDLTRFQALFPEFYEKPLLLEYLILEPSKRPAYLEDLSRLKRVCKSVSGGIEKMKSHDFLALRSHLQTIPDTCIEAANQFEQIYPEEVRSVDFFCDFSKPDPAIRSQVVIDLKHLKLLFSACSKNNDDPFETVNEILNFLRKEGANFTPEDVSRFKKVFPKTAIKTALMFQYLRMSAAQKEAFVQELGHEKRALLAADSSVVDQAENAVSALVLACLNRINLAEFKRGITAVETGNITEVPRVFKQPKKIEMSILNSLILKPHERQLLQNFMLKVSKGVKEFSESDWLVKVKETLEQAVLQMEKNNQTNTHSYKVIKLYLERAHLIPSETDFDIFSHVKLLTSIESKLKRKIISPFLSAYVTKRIFTRSEHLEHIFSEHEEEYNTVEDLDKYYARLIPAIKEFFDEVSEIGAVINLSTSGSSDVQLNHLYPELLITNEFEDNDILQQEINKYYRYKTLKSILERRLEHNPKSAKRVQVVLGAPKNEIDYFYAKDTCVSSHVSEIENPDFIPLRILNEDQTELEGFIWCVQEDHPDFGKILVVSDIHPELDIRGTYDPDTYYKEIIKVLKEYALAGGYSMLVQTTNPGVQSNDNLLRGAIQRHIKDLDSFKLSAIKKFPRNSSYDISCCSVLADLSVR